MDGLPAALRKGTGSIARWVPEGVKGHNFLRHFSLSGWERYLDASTLFREEEKDKLFRADARRLMSDADAACAGRECLAGENGHWLSAVQRWDLEGYLPLDILTKVDRATMAHSLEVRAPLLDHKLMELAASMPSSMKLRGMNGKYIFKKALKRLLPETVLHRRKMGFGVPLALWFRKDLKDLAHSVIFSRNRNNLLSESTVKHVWQEHQSGLRDRSTELWTLLMFRLWERQFITNAGQRRDSDVIQIRSAG